MMLTVSVNIM